MANWGLSRQLQHIDYGPLGRRWTTVQTDPVQVSDTHARSPGASTSTSISPFRRFLRAILYAGIFGASGFCLTWAWTTWSYLRVGQVINKPAIRARNKQRFDTQIEESALIQSLRKDGWIEEDPSNLEFHIEDGAHKTQNANAEGQHLVNEKLADDGHIATRHFRHPTDGMTVLVFVADSACESWPNTLHGGIATTVIQEALNTHVKNFPDYAPIRNRETTMNYRLPLHPKAIYSVLVRTDGIEYPYPSSSGADKSFMGVAVEVLLNEMDRAPRYVEKYDEQTKSHQRVCSIHDKHDSVTAYVKGGSILFLASKDYRDMLQKDPELVPALRQKRDAWLKAYESNKAKPKG